VANTIETIPEKKRWEIATNGLTGPLWYQAGKGAKQFADSLGLPTATAGDVEGITHLLALTSMGPEFKFDIVESTQDRCVGRTTECPWHKRWKEQGLDMDTCGAGHQAWGDGAVESLNPNFTFKLTRNMVRGDSYCEWVGNARSRAEEVEPEDLKARNGVSWTERSANLRLCLP